MTTEPGNNGLTAPSIQAPISGPGDSLFFAGIIYGDNYSQFSATLGSVLKQKASGLQLDIHVFHLSDKTPQYIPDSGVTLVPFEHKEDFFVKFARSIETSEARYCIVLQPGEELFEAAFDSAERIFAKHQQVNWLTGIQTIRAKGGFNVTLGTTAMRRWSYRIYERNLYKNSGRYIPSGSTFWRRSIWPVVSGDIHFVALNDFCEDLWLTFFKSQKLYTCKAYFSTSDDYEKLNERKLKLPVNYSLIEDTISGRLKEFLFINNIPYLRLFYRNESELAPVIRFDHVTQSYYLSEY